MKIWKAIYLDEDELKEHAEKRGEYTQVFVFFKGKEAGRRKFATK